MVMMRQTGKQQKRVYSLQPSNRLVRSSVFARRYVNCLLQALKMNKENEECSNNSDIHGLQKIIGYQVNMAMVLSAASTQGEFAWTRALKQKLQTSYCLSGKSFLVLHPRVSKPLSSLQNPRNTATYMTDDSGAIFARPHFGERTLAIKENAEEEEEAEADEMVVSRKLISLRRLLPGGKDMGDSELLEEVGSYVTCLQQQVTILRCLVGSNSSID